jgi:hypothetical protein
MASMASSTRALVAGSASSRTARRAASSDASTPSRGARDWRASCRSGSTASAPGDAASASRAPRSAAAAAAHGDDLVAQEHRVGASRAAHSEPLVARARIQDHEVLRARDRKRRRRRVTGVGHRHPASEAVGRRGIGDGARPSDGAGVRHVEARDPVADGDHRRGAMVPDEVLGRADRRIASRRHLGHDSPIAGVEHVDPGAVGRHREHATGGNGGRADGRRFRRGGGVADRNGEAAQPPDVPVEGIDRRDHAGGGGEVERAGRDHRRIEDAHAPEARTARARQRP